MSNVNNCNCPVHCKDKHTWPVIKKKQEITPNIADYVYKNCIHKHVWWVNYEMS